MIKRRDQLKVQESHEWLGGKGDIKVVHFFEEEDFNGKGRLFGKSILPAGTSIGYHQHKGDSEAYYILSGEALVNDNGKEAVLKAGDVLITKDGHYHSIENIGEIDLEYIALILFS
ncbi:cupin domain-containing protein [Clostridiaceae bacterium 35-E11]